MSSAPHRQFRIGRIDKHRDLISEVVMARMLMPRSDSALKLSATPAWLLMPILVTETLAPPVAYDISP